MWESGYEREHNWSVRGSVFGHRAYIKIETATEIRGAVNEARGTDTVRDGYGAISDGRVSIVDNSLADHLRFTGDNTNNAALFPQLYNSTVTDE